MNVNEVIKYPILSEKTYMQMEKNVYTFAVDRRTNKAEVKRVVEFIFDVKVEKVNIANVGKKAKKLGRFEGFTNAYKRAVVTLKEGQINIFPDEAVAEAPVKESKPAAKKETKEVSDAEKKAADKIAAKLKEKEAATEKKVEAPKVEAKKEVKKETPKAKAEEK